MSRSQKASILLLFLAILPLTGCSTPAEANSFTDKEGHVYFEYPSTWNVVSFADPEFTQNTKEYIQDLIESELDDLRVTHVSKNNALDYGDYGVYPDIVLEDFTAPKFIGNEDKLLKTILTSWYPSQKEAEFIITKYTNKNGVAFASWQGPSPTYDAEYILYAATYEDQDNQINYVIISALAGDSSVGQNQAKDILQVVDSLQVTPNI